jgi:hypothetical protein
MPNTNCLEGIRCPRCGYEDEFDIDATCTVTVTDEGTSDRGHDYEWGESNHCFCKQCCYGGELRTFKIENQIDYADAVSFIRAFIDAFQEFDDDAPVSGADCVDRVNALRVKAKSQLPAAQRG